MSDHGEDPDHEKGHESTKFTFKMARIPLFIGVSDTFVKQKPQVFKNLRAHLESFWTNDLLYDLMVDILSIQGVPDKNNDLNLASSEYKLTKDKAKTLHGEKCVAIDDGKD